MKRSKFEKLIRRVNIYPPLWGAGIRVRSHNDDFTRFDVELRPRWFTRNIFGTHFGGSLYSMADPFYVFIVTLNFGDGYIVWDKSASIDFIKPAKGVIAGIFKINQESLTSMRKEVDELGKSSFDFETDLVDESGQTVARVNKTIYIRTKALAN